MKRHFSPEFKLESAQLVLDQNYSVIESAMGRWVRQLKLERQGGVPRTLTEYQPVQKQL
ncbi:transposase [Xenorhabdus nematophila F1]|uniref:Transposase n=1 Tax=Xenorhabdus nematophila (strain ATCC 19061 / DSM 3370 / CCUG 14189 / LMG 1036 / NCIMB 9965 / AN6) TaxID=406817 RepID=D3VGI1_XENNA